MMEIDYRRSLTFMVDVRQRRTSVKMPASQFYVKEIQQCQDMYARLQLDRPSSQSVRNSSFPLLKERSSLVGRTRPLTYTKGQKVPKSKAVRPYSIRSAPAFMFKDELKKVDEDVEKDKNSENSSITGDYDEHSLGRKRTKMDSSQLCDYLEGHGFGVPVVKKASQSYRQMSQALPRGVRSRPLPKNPSQREKIKGRARLDQEMANMKALAFCEQQAPRAFRTASANMKHRDVQFLEEEMREHIHREDMNESDDDNASIVMMPMTQEELFVRIDTWLEEVESASRTTS